MIYNGDWEKREVKQLSLYAGNRAFVTNLKNRAGGFLSQIRTQNLPNMK
jgi:hypothetical protein